MIFSGHSRSLHLLRSSSDESLATSQDADARKGDRRNTKPTADTRSRTEKTTPWFAAKAYEKEPPKIDPSMRTEWPNGPPPSGPRSHRVAISPPATRRLSDMGERVRRLSDHENTTSFNPPSFHSSTQRPRTETLPPVSRSVENGSERMATRLIISAKGTDKAATDLKTVTSVGTLKNANHSIDNYSPVMSSFNKDFLWTGEADESESSVFEAKSKTQQDGFSMHQEAADPRQPEELLEENGLTHLSLPQLNQQSALLDETASVVSDLTVSSGAAVSGQSSMTSGSRARTCHKCKTAAQGVSPLLKCSECPRRYHCHCAVPKVPSRSQLNGALEWTCKRCVKNFQRNGHLFTDPHPISRNSTEKRGPPSISLPIGLSETNAARAISLRRRKSSYNTDTGNSRRKIVFTAVSCNDHARAPADFDLGQGVKDSDNHDVPPDIEQPNNPDDSAFHLTNRTSEARTVEEDSRGGVISVALLNTSNSSSGQSSLAQYRSNYDIYSPPHIRPETDVGQSPNETVTARQPTSVEPAAIDRSGQHQRQEHRGSPLLETSTHERPRTSRLDLDVGNSENGALATSAETSLESIQSTSHATTTTEKLQQPQELTLSKKEVQWSKMALKRLTCHHWKQRGGCRYREEECQYAHHDTGMDEGKNTTCFWWWTFGHCKKSERECLYAHRDTGLYAKAPPSYIPQKRACIPPRSPERPTKNGRTDHYSPPAPPRVMRTSAEDVPTRPPPPLRTDAMPSSIPESSWDRPTVSNTDQAANNRVEQTPVVADPRLPRRPSSMSTKNLDTLPTTSKLDTNITGPTGQMDPVTPEPVRTNANEAPSSFNKCRRCDKKVFGSASLCFSCKGTKPAMSGAVIKSSPFVPETPEVDATTTRQTEDKSAPEVRPPPSPENQTLQAVNPLKRMSSVLEPGHDASMFIKKKVRRFKPSEPRRSSTDMSTPQMDSVAMKDKPCLPPRPNAAVGGILLKNPVPLADLIELERLRKQVALLEKSNEEEKRAHEEARRLRAEEKDRADGLHEELQVFKVHHQDVIKSNQEERKKSATKVAETKKEQDHGLQDDAARAPQIARRSKTFPNHMRRQSSNDFDRMLEASIHGPTRPRTIRVDKVEAKLFHEMEKRGIVFESDDESDDGPEVPAPTPFKPPKDPLWRPPRASRDLFEIAPQYLQENLSFDIETKRKEIGARPSRKQTFGRVLALSHRERGSPNVHREVDRGLPSRMVRTWVVDDSGDADPFTETEQKKEVEMSCEEFLGLPGNAVFCLTTTQQLAYRDGALDRWGKLPRVPDDEKFEIGA